MNKIILDDENPEWTKADFAAARPADEVHGDGVAKILVRRGRPRKPIEEHKRPVLIRLSPDILEYFKSTGKGWHSRINDALRTVMPR